MSKERHECLNPIRGPLGTVVGTCELDDGHEGPCRVNGVSEQDMVDTLSVVSVISERTEMK